jgi:hypothetical protein
MADPYDPSGQRYLVCSYERCEYMMKWPPPPPKLWGAGRERRPAPEKPHAWYRPPEKPRRKPGYSGVG